MNSCIDILLIHYQMYPLMQIEDFIKLIYQMIFGPKHFSSNPTIEQIKSYLKLEIEQMSTTDDKQIIEDIGNYYVRLHLAKSYLDSEIIEQITNVFFQSMNEDIDDQTKLENDFINCLYICMNLIKSQKIEINYTTAKLWVETYIAKGIRPISHSLTYKKMYHPHYRVIHRSKIENTPFFKEF